MKQKTENISKIIVLPGEYNEIDRNAIKQLQDRGQNVVICNETKSNPTLINYWDNIPDIATTAIIGTDPKVLNAAAIAGAGSTYMIYCNQQKPVDNGCTFKRIQYDIGLEKRPENNFSPKAEWSCRASYTL